ncbi:MAG: hypothetical protein ACREIC_09375 [Limisphaerales bacterium]
MIMLKQFLLKRRRAGQGSLRPEIPRNYGARRVRRRRREQESARHFQLPSLWGIVLVAMCSCSREPLRGSMVLSQTPAKPVQAHAPADILDLRYPAGTRVVLAGPDFKHFEALSKGFYAAGDPQVSCDGKCVVFSGKLRASDDWQIYEVKPGAGSWRAITSIRGGAMSPALLPHDQVVFVSPVTKLSVSNTSRALYVIRAGEPSRQLSFTPSDLSEPTVLSDGRILFVEHRRCAETPAADRYALLTINNDGTEVTQFSALPDPTQPLHGPRELADGRIAFVVPGPSEKSAIHIISAARPYAAPEVPALPFKMVSSFSASPEGGLFLCAEPVSGLAAGKHATALYVTRGPGLEPGPPLMSDPDWNTIEAVGKSARVPPMGRLSNVDPSEKTGLILCLNANFTRNKMAKGTRIRVLAQVELDEVRSLGDVPLQPDGSFMAEVPAEVPLGFELLDEHAKTVLRLAPSIWVRPGENRSCIGCHEPPNQSPRNFRPLAVSVPAPNLRPANRTLAQAKGAPHA